MPMHSECVGHPALQYCFITKRTQLHAVCDLEAKLYMQLIYMYFKNSYQHYHTLQGHKSSLQMEERHKNSYPSQQSLQLHSYHHYSALVALGDLDLKNKISCQHANSSSYSQLYYSRQPATRMLLIYFKLLALQLIAIWSANEHSKKIAQTFVPH